MRPQEQRHGWSLLFLFLVLWLQERLSFLLYKSGTVISLTPQGIAKFKWCKKGTNGITSLFDDKNTLFSSSPLTLDESTFHSCTVHCFPAVKLTWHPDGLLFSSLLPSQGAYCFSLLKCQPQPLAEALLMHRNQHLVVFKQSKTIDSRPTPNSPLTHSLSFPFCTYWLFCDYFCPVSLSCLKFHDKPISNPSPRLYFSFLCI